MQLLFVHPNFPAQFGPSLMRLGKRPDLECVFVSRTSTGSLEGVRRIRFNHCSRTFENAVWQAHALYEVCKATHGSGLTGFLQQLYPCPIITAGRALIEERYSLDRTLPKLERLFVRATGR